MVAVSSRGAAGRLSIAALVLLTEYLAISTRFDVVPVAAWGGAWRIFAHLGTVGLVAGLAGLALYLLGLPLRAPASEPRARIQVSRLVLHAVLLAVFVGVTGEMLGGARPPAGPAALWLTAWFVTGTAATWMLFSALYALRLAEVRPHLSVGAAGVVVGLLGWQVGQFSSRLWDPLAASTTAAVATVLRLLGQGQVRQPDVPVLALDGFVVRIDHTCSGLEGMGLAAVFTAVCWYAFRRDLRFPNALALLPISLGLAWLANIVRIVVLMWVGAFVDPDLAIGGFHSKAGWVFFCVVALIVGSLSRRLSFFSSTAKLPQAGADNPTAAYLIPLLAVVGTALVTGMGVKTFDQWYGLRIVAAAVALYAYWHYYPRLEVRGPRLAVVTGAAIAVAWIAIPGPAADAAVVDAIARDAGPGWILVRLIGAAIVIPLCEELAFRGYLIRKLVAHDFTRVSLRTATPIAIAVSSVAFGLLHERWMLATVAGLAYALVQMRTGRVWDAVLAHGVSNAVIALWVVARGDFSHWT